MRVENKSQQLRRQRHVSGQISMCFEWHLNDVHRSTVHHLSKNEIVYANKRMKSSDSMNCLVGVLVMWSACTYEIIIMSLLYHRLVI